MCLYRLEWFVTYHNHVLQSVRIPKNSKKKKESLCDDRVRNGKRVIEKL